MNDDKTNLQIYKEIRKQVQKRYDKRKEFLSHLVAYLISMVGGWLILSSWQPPGPIMGIAGLITIGWTMGIIIHGIDAWYEEVKDRAVNRELERMGILRDVYEKAKRDERLMRLTDDGELTELDETYLEDDYQHTRRTNS